MRGFMMLVFFVLTSAQVAALDPGEVLPDTALEARARALSAELRCAVCQNQTIDDSDAPLAKDLRLFIRQGLVAGHSDAEIIGQITQRYGEFVLFRPRFDAKNYALWFAPFLLLIFGLFTLWRVLRNTQD